MKGTAMASPDHLKDFRRDTPPVTQGLAKTTALRTAQLRENAANGVPTVVPSDKERGLYPRINRSKMDGLEEPNKGPVLGARTEDAPDVERPLNPYECAVNGLRFQGDRQPPLDLREQVLKDYDIEDPRVSSNTPVWGGQR